MSSTLGATRWAPATNMNPNPQHHTNRSPTSRRRIIEEDESDTEDVLPGTLLAVQQLSERFNPTPKKPAALKMSSRQRDVISEVVNERSECVSSSQQAVEDKTKFLMDSIIDTVQACPRLSIGLEQSNKKNRNPSRLVGELTVQDTTEQRQNIPLSNKSDHVKLFPSSKKRHSSPKNKGNKPRSPAYQGRYFYVSNAPYSSTDTWIFIPPAKRPVKTTVPKREKAAFLSLPGELRNQIYEQVLPECRILIQRTRPNKELDLLKNTWSTELVKHKRPPTRLFHMVDTHQINQGLGLTMNLLLACKEVRDDVELYLYSRTTFCFDSLKVLRSFLSKASKQGLQAIRKLELRHEGYGNPELTDNDKFREKYYGRWCQICSQIGEVLVSLSDLKIDAHLQEWPCDMSGSGLNAPWRNAFLQMAPRRLPRVNATLRHTMFHCNTRLMKDLAHRLEDDMMTQEGRHERDLIESKMVLAELEAKRVAKEARRKAKEAKKNAPTELTITMDQIKQQKPSPVKVCSKDLDNYSRLETMSMCPGELYMFKEQYCSERHKR
ncbi:hypothetical protein H2198_007841 [Neophaeococcomyces mojaviensis]|uniref:Uncharacterized protein n=1 Tax=Neophaeococcomyces mojaviensis TaxID=3383035 RepID=A0ACC2ZYY9_9EURO|nr:hypothetical protein H2198_007841 [Knufia sp. JES_112]